MAGSGQAGRKVFAKLNGQSTDRLMQRLGAATTTTTTSCSYQAVFINYDREARRQLRQRLHWKNVQNVLALGDVAK